MRGQANLILRDGREDHISVDAASTPYVLVVVPEP
jgi:hypothetical protein